MHKIVFILLMLIIASGYSFAQKKDEAARPVKGYSKVVIGKSANTLWQSSVAEANEGIIFYQYLRFYPDGTVIGVSSTGAPADLELWFNKPYDNTGTYSFVGTSIKFSLTSPYGAVDYQGSIARGVLTLKSYSHINGNRALIKYTPVRKATKGKKQSKSKRPPKN